MTHTDDHGDAGGREYGVFLPIGSGGWIVSESAPEVRASYADNRAIAVLAEQGGLDFIMSMAKWRGYGGTTDHWGETLESLTMMSALAEATERIGIWSTVHSNLFPPAVAAKMMVTLDQVSGGRAGLNVVSGAYAGEFRQMGAWSDTLDHDARYRYTEEWMTLVERLWEEDSVTASGEFFDLVDCQSRPHPASRPMVISAGRSRPGLEFQARHCDGAFLTGVDGAALRGASLEVKELAEGLGRSIRTYSMLTIVQGETDADAESRFREYGRVADIEALVNMKVSWGLPLDRAMSLTADDPEHEAFQTAVVVGSAATIVERITELMEYTALDGLMTIFPDYLTDLPRFTEDVLPALRLAEPSVALRPGGAAIR